MNTILIRKQGNHLDIGTKVSQYIPVCMAISFECVFTEPRNRVGRELQAQTAVEYKPKPFTCSADASNFLIDLRSM